MPLIPFLRPISLSIVFALFVPAVVLSEPLHAKVGVMLPLTGPLAPMGIACQRGLFMFKEEHPESRVTFLFEDHKYDGKASLTAFHKLHEVDAVDMSIIWGNVPTGAVAPIAESLSAPLLAASFNPDAHGRRYVVTLGPKMEQLVDQIAEAFKKWKIQNPAAVTVDFGSAVKGVEMLGAKLPMPFTTKIITAEETSMGSLLLPLRQKKVDGLVLFAVPDQAMKFIAQAAQVQFYPKVIGGDVFADEEFLRKAASMLPELSFVYGAVEKPFIDRVRTRWGTTSFFFEVATGYTLASLVDRLYAKNEVRDYKLNPLEALRNLRLDDMPLSGLKLSDDSEYGLHFETMSRVYSAKE